MADNYKAPERELGWDDTIEHDSPDFILLPEGDYDFTVTELSRERHTGSAKLPPCNKAVLTLRFDTPDGTAFIKHNLFLHTKTEGMVCAFFTGIGQRKKGEPLKMNWNTVIGSTGRAKVTIREWTGDDGEVRKSNDIKRIYEKDSAEQKTFTPGKF